MTATTPASSALVRPFTVAIAESEIDDFNSDSRELDGRIGKPSLTGRKVSA